MSFFVQVERFYKHHRPGQYRDEIVFALALTDEGVVVVDGRGTRTTVPLKTFCEHIELPQEYVFMDMSQSGGTAPRYERVTTAIEVP